VKEGIDEMAIAFRKLPDRFRVADWDYDVSAKYLRDQVCFLDAINDYNWVESPAPKCV
jgi:hypothetical protein